MQAQLTAGCAQRAQAPFTAARQQAKRRVAVCSAARQQQGQLAAVAVALQAAAAAPALAASEAVGQVGDGSMAMALTGGAALAGLAAVLVATDPTHRCGREGAVAIAAAARRGACVYTAPRTSPVCCAPEAHAWFKALHTALQLGLASTWRVRR